jgi:hypothetical protein
MAIRVPLYAALVFFVVAAILGVITNRPAAYQGVSEDGLDELLTRDWSDPPDTARKMIAEVLITELKAARSANDTKSSLLLAAIAAEVAAMALVAASVALVIALA